MLLVFARARFAIVAVVLSLVVPSMAAAQASPQQDLRQADQIVQQAGQALAAGDVAGASQLYDQYRANWRQIEDGVKAVSPGDYAAIEAAQREVRTSLLVQPPDTARATAALAALHEAHQDFIATALPADEAAPRSTPANDSERLRVLIADLDATRAAVTSHDASSAL